ncbi:MAG TPA: class II glutamine amidotransferase [Gemmataceae bacterium]|nr:class II glutamine amidotransferase [Gemmataceae bacterium]
MCRLFGLRANHPRGVYESLLGSPTALVHQSVCDRRRECHDNGWGIGYYADGSPVRIRAATAAADDPHYRELAETVSASCVLAHIRKASAGSVAERNSHPFMYGRWLFAHNGTLYGFDKVPERLNRLIPAAWQHPIEGETDSEHAFFFLMAQLANPESAVAPDELLNAMTRTIHTLAELYPGKGEERSQLNFLITDGQLMAASRWGHSLCWLDLRRSAGPAEQAVEVASEPTTDENWAEIADRSLICVTPNLEVLQCVIG